METTMLKFATKEWRIVWGGAFMVLISGAPLASANAQAAAPDFQTAWFAIGAFFEGVGTPTPTRQDPRYPLVLNAANFDNLLIEEAPSRSVQVTSRVGDVSNPNFKPWVARV